MSQTLYYNPPNFLFLSIKMIIIIIWAVFGPFLSNILAATDVGGSPSSVISFWLFFVFMGFLSQEYWSGLPLSSPVDHVLSCPDYQGHVLQPLFVTGQTCPAPWLSKWWCPNSGPSLALGHVNLHSPVGVSQCATSGLAKGPVGFSGKGVQGRLELRLEDDHELRAPWPHCCCWLSWELSATHMAHHWPIAGHHLSSSLAPQSYCPGLASPAAPGWWEVLHNLLPHHIRNSGLWSLPCSHHRTPPNTKKMSFFQRRLECRSKKSRDTWQIWPWSTKWSRAKANIVLSREYTGHCKYPLPPMQEMTVAQIMNPLLQISYLNWRK